MWPDFEASWPHPVNGEDETGKPEWWGKQDSNLRRLSQRIYSPPPLPLGTFPHLG